MNVETVSVRAVVQWPRHAEAQGRYLVVADVVLDEPGEWPYAQEEFIIGCVLEGDEAFRVGALGPTGLVLHRFGGTYGPVRFVVHADRDPRSDGSDGLRLTLVTEGGVPFQTLSLPILPRTAQAAGGEGSRLVPAVPQPRVRPSLGTAGAAPRKPRRSALLVAPSGDAVEAVTSVLRAHYGFDHIRFQTDDAPHGIDDAYEELISGAGPDDAVVVYLRGHARRHTRDELDSFHRRLTAVVRNVTVIYDGSSMIEGWRPDLPSDPRLVEVYADSGEEHAHGTVEPEHGPSLFGRELAQALTEAAGLRITWATLIDQVHRRMLRQALGQRPAVTGPAQRVLFGTAEAGTDSSLPVVPSKRGDLVQILGARLLNVQVGDEFTIEAGDRTILGTATVEGFAPFGAYARVKLLNPSTTIPTGARAHRTRAVAERLAVRLPPLDDDLQRLSAAVGSSPMLRLSDADDWVYEVRIDDRHRLTIRDRIGPLSDPVSAMSGTGRVLADLERLARAAALRRLADDPLLTMEPVTVDFGQVAAGGELLPRGGTPLLHPGDAIYVSLRNNGEQPVHVSLIKIGAAAEVAVLTHSSPSGVRLDPGDRYDAPRLKAAWPAGLAPTGRRPETILVITTAEPHDLGSLEQRGVHAPGRGSPLAQLLAQASYGFSRATGIGRGDRSGAYAIRSITYGIAPAARPVSIPEDWPAPGSIISAAELRSLAPRLREHDVECDADLVAKIVSDVAQYNAFAHAVPGPNPPPPLDELLRLMGWLIYEASWEAVQRVPATLDATVTTADELNRGLVTLEHISALADAARSLPWPEFAGRALGAIRAQALAESKRDTEAGYQAAWTVHQEANRRYTDYREALSPHNRAHERYLRDLDEVLLQLALAETGRACRRAERVISRWSEDFTDHDEEIWVERIWGDLWAGANIGERAIDTGLRIQREYGFVDRVTEDRLALHSALQNPGIMTARASALLLALGPAARRVGIPPETFPTWADWETHEIGRFTKAYQTIEAPVVVGNRTVPIRPTVLRQLIHMRLNLALLKPGHHLPSVLSFDPVLEMAELNDEALAALSSRLAPGPGRPGNERGLGAAMMPAVIRSIRAGRGRGPDDRGYDEWRIDWFRLDRFSHERGRRTRLDEALAASR